MDLGTERAQDETGSEQTALECLERLHDRGFGGDTFMLSLALGREEEQIRTMLAGDEEIDEDLDMKIRGIAQERGIDLT